MLSWLRRKASPSSPTYRERVEDFWEKFRKVAPRFYKTIENKKCPDLTNETIAMVKALHPDLAWVYGPGPDHKGHSLTLSGEGVLHRQLLAQRWLASAPSIPGWTFYASRQAGPIAGHVIKIHDTSFDPKEIWVTPSIDTENEKIDLNIWHPAWPTLSDKQRWTVIFLFLDESLGEYGTQWWIGDITWGEERLKDALPLEELAEYAQRTSQEHEWRKYPPGEAWTLFSFKPDDNTYPRADLITLTTMLPSLLREYTQANGDLADPLEGTGADYLYIAIERDFFPRGSETDKRGELEDLLENALSEGDSGKVIGGGLGSEFGYVDLLIFDGNRSLEKIKAALAGVPVPSGTMIEYFAREKRTHRIAM